MKRNTHAVSIVQPLTETIHACFRTIQQQTTIHLKLTMITAVPAHTWALEDTLGHLVRRVLEDPRESQESRASKARKDSQALQAMCLLFL